MPNKLSHGLAVTVAGANSSQATLIAAAIADCARLAFLQDLQTDAVIDAVQGGGSNLVLLLAGEADDALLETCGEVAMQTQLPVVIFVETAPANAAAQFVRRGASSFIVKGLAEDRLSPIIETAMERHRLVSALQNELLNSKSELTARKTIERAKGLLMQQQSLSEAEAYDSMRRVAMERGLKLVKVAQTIIGLSDLAPSAGVRGK
ncbi:ANTAR domain-containing response regulator [Henriciella aquimarina]|uniref:ANTAR domain-containing response regulator n=1 Tax=Henriciella aquimarina TaxID=545261 RepID=UPI0009FE5209|nr:ANTAR domain-containing protein [Henriciella aquimarina]